MPYLTAISQLTTVGYGDITPSNIGEVIVAIIVMLIGIMSFAVLIGSMQEVFKVFPYSLLQKFTRMHPIGSPMCRS